MADVKAFWKLHMQSAGHSMQFLKHAKHFKILRPIEKQPLEKNSNKMFIPGS